MNIADALNPFFFRIDTDAIRDPKTHVIVTPATTTIYSAVDEVTLANTTAGAAFATVVNNENDLDIQGLDIILACDLPLLDRGDMPARNVTIRCRTLTILGDTKTGLTIDASGVTAKMASTHAQPDKAAPLANASQRATAGDDIAYALNDDKQPNAWQNWFIKNPGTGYKQKGAVGGKIRIACETLKVKSKLVLRANGAKGTAGVGGQSFNAWLPGVVGGDAGSGGQGGDSGTIELVCAKVTDLKDQPLNLADAVEVECNGGDPGEPGLPGFCYDGKSNDRHMGSYAIGGDSGTTNDAERSETRSITFDDALGPVTIADVSPVASSYSLHFWALLYHRLKLAYLQNQPLKYQMPSGTDPSWIALGELLGWGQRLTFAYGDTSAAVKGGGYVDVSTDPDVEAKNSIARAVKLMWTWYRAGKTMWGSSISTVPSMPFDTLCGHVDRNFVHQVDVRNFYIRLRTQLADAIKANDAYTNISNSAEYAVQLHEAAVDDLKRLLYGSTDKGGVDAQSLLGELISSDAGCNQAIDQLSTDLTGLDDIIQKNLNLSVSDVLDSLKSMCFVAGDPKAFLGMGAIEGFNLYEKARNTVTDDAGNALAKDAVIKQVHDLKGGLDELSKTVHGMVDNKDVGKLDAAILTSLDNIDAYIGKFTTLLGNAGKDVTDEVSALRQKINYKNDVWMEYNDRLYQLAKEWEDYQGALAKKQQIDTSNQQDLTASLLDAVQLYTDMYLSNLERTADLWAQLVRKFSYVTLNADLPSSSFLGQVSAFWSADAQAAQAMADQADSNWDINRSAVIGSSADSDSLRYHLHQYNADSQAIVVHAPDKENKNKKSTFFIDVRGGGSDAEKKVIERLLSHQAVWLQVVPPATFNGKYTDADGKFCPAPRPSSAVLPCQLVSGSDWDVRVTHVNPWMEGLYTDSKTVQFHIKLGTSAYIVDAATPPVAHYFGYNEKAVNTQFAHETRAVLSDPTNARIAGDAAGEVSDENIDKRGIFVPVQLAIPKGALNENLRPAGDIAAVNLRIHFRVIFRASVNALSAPV